MTLDIYISPLPEHKPLPGSPFEAALKGSRTLYTVQGSTGMYDDHYEWALLSFTDKEKAVDYAGKANEWLRERGLNSQGKTDFDDYQEALKGFPFDDLSDSNIEGGLSYEVLASTLAGSETGLLS